MKTKVDLRTAVAVVVAILGAAALFAWYFLRGKLDVQVGIAETGTSVTVVTDSGTGTQYVPVEESGGP